MKHLIRLISAMAFLLMTIQLANAQESILSVRNNVPSKMIKGQIQGANTEVLSPQNQNVERFQYRGFTILLNPYGNQYEAQAYRMVQIGNRKVNSIFSSVFRSSIEYSYQYDASRKKIIRHHFLFPPNSLTGWANPGEYAAMDQFDWGSDFPAKSCSLSVPIHTLEEFGREYLEAACLPDHDTALAFTKKFIDYMLSSRI